MHRRGPLTRQDRGKNSNVTNCIDTVSDCTLSLLRNYTLSSFSIISNKNKLQLSKKNVKTAFSLFPLRNCVRLNFLHTLQSYHNILNVKADMIIHLSYIKLATKKVCKNVNHYHYFLFWKIVIFLRNGMYVNI